MLSLSIIKFEEETFTVLKKYSYLFLLYLLTFNVTTYAASSKNVVQPKVPIQTSLIIDGATGKVLHAKNAKHKIYPASLTKVMTLYLLFESLEAGRINLNHKFHVSKHATQALPSKLYLKQGEKISVKDSIHALTIKSANDVARVVGENIAGSEAKFANLMTLKARKLGMSNTTFTNASGWHDPKQMTTAVDLAKLTMAIRRDFPQYYHFFAQTSFNFKGKTINGHNRVTATYPGAEGLKTGYHIPAGCNLITTAKRGNKILIAVVTGRKSAAIRDRKMVELLDKHFGVIHPTIKKATIVNNKNKKKTINKKKQKSIKLASKG